MLIDFTGFATWVTGTSPNTPPHCSGLHRPGGLLRPLPPLEAPRVGETHQGQPDLPDPLHPGHHRDHRPAHDHHPRGDRHRPGHDPLRGPRLLHLCGLEEQARQDTAVVL